MAILLCLVLAYSNSLMTVYYRRKLGISRNNVMQHYRIIDGKWSLKVMKNIDHRLLFYHHYQRNLDYLDTHFEGMTAEYFSALEEGTDAQFVEERTKEEVLWLLEKY